MWRWGCQEGRARVGYIVNANSKALLTDPAMPLNTATLKAVHNRIRHLTSGETCGNLGPCIDP